MPASEEEFLRQLLEAFKIEATEHVEALSAGLLELEKTEAPQQKPLIEKIYREAHSLKGAARAVNVGDIESVCQSLENVFAAWKRGELRPAAESFDVLHRVVDALRPVLGAPGETRITSAEQTMIGEQLGSLLRGAKTAPPAQPPLEGACSVSTPSFSPAPKPAKPVPELVPEPLPTAAPVVAMAVPAAPETVRISTGKLDTLLLEAEEMLALKISTHQRVEDLRTLDGMLGSLEKQLVELQSVDTSRSQLKAVSKKSNALLKSLEQDERSMDRMVDELLEDSKKLVMLPFATLAGAFPKMVRDLSREQGKEIEFSMHGAEVEIDKRILEELKDPLIHLLRNAIDHGIETPDERRAAGKPPRATVRLTFAQTSGKVQIIAQDDGAGIDAAAVKAAAIRKGLIMAAEADGLAEKDALNLIFRSDVSTSPIITEISGRGLGLAIVREKIDKLGGSVEIETQTGRGTTFRLRVPLTLATFRGIIVRASDQLFVVPIANVERVVRVSAGDIKAVENRETIALNNHALSLVRLCDVLGLPRPKADPKEAWPVLVLFSGETHIAFAVEEIHAEQEVLVKPLAKPLSRVRNIAGATVLGEGTAVAVLNISDLLKSATKAVAIAREGETETAPEAKSVMVVEDSITARMLLKNILEAAGYEVITAVDGLDGLTALKTRQFAAVVSDVDMPRMDGFGLTEKIRADKKFAELPVVLVTARESREDRERGIDVGANAYIVKSSFDQSNLLDVLKRLV